MTYIDKILHFLFSFTLFSFAGLQFNDPDPILWVSFYIICALVPGLLLFNKFYRPLFWAALAICSTEIIISAPGAYQYFLNMAHEPLMQSMNAEKPYIEECREFLGALIALGLVILSALLGRS
ncbi:MAG: transmembrane 220 family protein, partial [Cellvibrio sp.]